MDRLSLGQQVTGAILKFIATYPFWVVIALFVSYYVWVFYDTFYRIRREEDIDLMVGYRRLAKLRRLKYESLRRKSND